MLLIFFDLPCTAHHFRLIYSRLIYLTCSERTWLGTSFATSMSSWIREWSERRYWGCSRGHCRLRTKPGFCLLSTWHEVATLLLKGAGKCGRVVSVRPAVLRTRIRKGRPTAFSHGEATFRLHLHPVAQTWLWLCILVERDWDFASKSCVSLFSHNWLSRWPRQVFVPPIHSIHLCMLHNFFSRALWIWALCFKSASTRFCAFQLCSQGFYYSSPLPCSVFLPIACLCSSWKKHEISLNVLTC